MDQYKKQIVYYLTIPRRTHFFSLKNKKGPKQKELHGALLRALCGLNRINVLEIPEHLEGPEKHVFGVVAVSHLNEETDHRTA